ncbi:competence/damage-inducible protein-like protein cinA [Amniculicola lignicola CBS 123094]|uniref:Competence/damage-inducible protein-like protein cinA n=1 Tax=Amniculicola lignicola CBS 123094 TaxID=1392246 RepID=A0A6A5X440_9PLEO|nr:competence/damage-inducible protein-like protein cinA [Amniculicola lignicola CBS 123094]
MASSPPSTFPPPELRALAQEIATLLKERKETISVAETAAGGLISATLLSYPGASGYYAGGLTLYTLASRIAYCGWTEESVKGYTGPNPDIVRGLAEHTRKTLGSTYTVSESGTAGPTGGKTRNRTPGYVALAVAREGGETVTREVETGGSGREENMVRFAVEGLKLVRDVIKGEGKL